MTRSRRFFSCAGAVPAIASARARARIRRIAIVGASRRTALRSPPDRRADLRVDDRPHELGGEAGLLVGVLDPDRPAVDHGELVAELVADEAAVADLAHGPGEVGVVTVRLLADDPVVALEAANRAVGAPLELAAEVGEHLERSDRTRRVADA